MKTLIIKTIVMNDSEIDQWIEDNLTPQGKKLILSGEKVEIRRTSSSLTTYEIKETKENT